MNFFKIHENSKIGYKRLSTADLGTGDSSHQTHIGLHETSLDYLQNFRRDSISPFVYNETNKELLCLLDFIKRSNGKMEAPKIKSGSKAELMYNGIKINSVTKEIREIAKNEGIELDWYLMWFGLENEDLVFFLFNNSSEDFAEINRLIGTIRIRGTIQKENREFTHVLTFLENKLNKTSVPYLEELEIIAQTNDDVSTKIIKPRFFDIEKARALFQVTGKKGEELVAIYLENLKQAQTIKDFKWMNASKESGYPYDFEIYHNDGKLIFSDAKTTSYTFEQKMIFSKQEIKFINQSLDYHVFRVYNLNKETPTMKVCQNINELSSRITLNINAFEKELLINDTFVKELKLAISPINRTLQFSSEILLK